MLPAPAADDARAFIAKLARINDPERRRILDGYEKLYKGEAWDQRPSFWDNSVPLNERGPAVQSSVAESAGGRLISMVFGNARFPTATVGESAYGVEYADDEQETLSKLWTHVVEGAELRPKIREALRQGFMLGTFVGIGSLQRGRVELKIVSAKDCTPTFDEEAELSCVEHCYRHDITLADGSKRCVWYRRVIDTQTDTVWDNVPVDDNGFQPRWELFPPQSVTNHALGFVPVIWHRHAEDPSDPDPIDGTPLFCGLEDEIFGLDMAMSQLHRNGRYNGEPQMVRIGVIDENGAKPMGEPGRAADPKASSWFSRAWDSGKNFLGFGSGSTVKKGPGKVWDVPQGGDAKLLESTGAGKDILQADIDNLRRVILDARGIVIASPEQIGANASAALMREVFGPMVAVADNVREEWGHVLCDVVNMLIRIAYTARVQGKSVFLRTLDDAIPALQRSIVPIDMGDAGVWNEWVGVPFKLTWGEYFEPTWTDIQTGLAAAMGANGGQPVLTVEQSVKMIAPLVGIDDPEEHAAFLQAQNEAQRQAANAMLAPLLNAGHATPAGVPNPNAVAPVNPNQGGAVPQNGNGQ